MTALIAVMAGDGVGPEITEQAIRVLESLGLNLEIVHVPVGGVAYAEHGHPLPSQTLEAAKKAKDILIGAVGDWQYDSIPRHLRPDPARFGLRKALELLATL